MTKEARVRDKGVVGPFGVDLNRVLNIGKGLGEAISPKAKKKEQAAPAPNPALDPQLSVYDSVQKVLSAGIANLASTAATSSPPTQADLDYGTDGDPVAEAARWTAMAHTMKARFFMHTAEVRGAAAYAAALAEAQQGIKSKSGNFVGAFTANSGEQNFYYQFDGPLPTTGEKNATVTVPTVSLDTGVVLERNTNLFGRNLVQTLEPRAFYVYTPFRDQSTLPNYDSAPQDFNFASIWTENAFAGNDRISSRDSRRDVIDCGPGRDAAIVDRVDRTRRCETVIRAHAQRRPQRPGSPRAQDRDGHRRARSGSSRRGRC